MLESGRVTQKTIVTEGHEGNEGNEESDKLAKEAASKPTPDALDLTVRNTFNIQGAKLSELTQSIAYQGIRERKPPLDRQSSTNNINTSRDAIERYTGSQETDASIWSSLRKAPIRPKVSQFLYKSMHNVFRTGNYWSHIPAVAECSVCTTCNETETLGHIMTQCRCPPTQLIWRYAREIWPHRNIPWPEISLGLILGSGCLSAPHPNNRERNNGNSHLRGATRLLRILITESAYLIWVLRCERVIGEKNIHERGIRSRWLRAINLRLTNDKLIATKKKRKKGFTNLVVNTWEHVLSKEGDLPNNWINMREVLVGSRSR